MKTSPLSETETLSDWCVRWWDAKNRRHSEYTMNEQSARARFADLLDSSLKASLLVADERICNLPTWQILAIDSIDDEEPR